MIDHMKKKNDDDDMIYILLKIRFFTEDFQYHQVEPYHHQLHQLQTT